MICERIVIENPNDFDASNMTTLSICYNKRISSTVSDVGIALDQSSMRIEVVDEIIQRGQPS